MADKPSSAAGKRFSEDLRRIREARDISVDELHNETRIAQTLIESFEEGRIYDHPTYNRVYLRSFLKAYSDVVGLPREEVLSGLDLALEGSYQHELASAYLSSADEDASSGLEDMQEEDDSGEGGEAESDSTRDREPSEGPTAGGPEGRGGIVGPPRAVGEEPEEDQISMEEPPPEVASEASGDEDEERKEEEQDTDDDDREAALTEEEEANEEDDRAESETDADESDADESDEVEWPPVQGEEVDEDGGDERDVEDETDIAAATGGDAADGGEEDELEMPDMSGPEALRSTPDDEDDDERDVDADAGDEPAWMQGDGDDEGDEWAAAESAPEEGPDDLPAMEGEDAGMGVVGEPTEMGQGDPSGAGAAPPSGPGEDSTGRGSAGGLLTGENRGIVITGIGIAVVLLVLIGLGIAYFSSTGEEASSSPPDTTTAETAPSSVDTSAAAATPDTAAADTGVAPADTVAERPPPADVTLGTTIHLTVLAKDNVRGIRLRRDDDLRRPYWIEKGEASVFPFERRAVVASNFLDDVRLFVEGYPYPYTPADTVGGLELTRETLQAFVDTLRGTPPSLSVSPDTMPVGGSTEE